MRNESPDCKLHVAQFIDSMDPGGAEEVVISLTREFVDAGYSVTIFHFGNPWLVQRIEDEGFDHVVLHGRYYKSIVTLPLFIGVFRKILKKHDIDVLHAHLLGAIFAGALTARLCGIASIGTIHDTYSLRQRRMHPRYLAWAQKSGCQLVAVAESMRVEVAALCGMNIAAIKRIYNGVHPERFEVKAKPEMQNAVVRLVTVARAVEVKRLDLLLEVMVAIETDAPFELSIVGDGPLLLELNEKARILNLGRRVRFLGYRSDVSSILANSDIFVLVSDSEGLSVSLLESMAAALPSVVTDVGGNRELVADGESGYLAPAGDAGMLAKQLSSLIENGRQRREFGNNARRRAEESFSVSSMAERYLDLIDIGHSCHV